MKARMMQGEIRMIWKDLILSKFNNGFRILNNRDVEDKFFVIDDVKFEIGDEFRVGPNGYFEHIGNINNARKEVNYVVG
jgi:hypothetical protein